MVALLNMPRAAWRRQPSGYAKISPIWQSMGLKIATTPGIHLEPPISQNVPTRVRPSGVAYDFNDTDRYLRYRNTLTSSDVSVFVLIDPDIVYVDGGQGMGTYVSSRTSGNSGWSFYDKSAVTFGDGNEVNTLSFTIQGVAEYTQTLPTGTLPAKFSKKTVGFRAKSGSPVDFFVDGVKYPRAGAIGTIGIGEDIIIGKQGPYDSNLIYYGQPMLLAAVFDRFLDESVFVELNRNHWQLFAPDPPRFYLIPSSGGVITLIVQNASHGHSVEAPSLTQAHVLALADSLHGHSVESPILSQAYALTLAAAAHSHNVGSLDLTQAHSLSVAETSHTQSVDSVNLLQAHVLNLSESLHSHSVESPTLSAAGTLSVAEANHAHSVEAPSLIQAHTLAVQDASHSHSADALTLTQAYVLTPADATHGHSVEVPTLSTELNLAVADSLHSHTVDAPGLTQAHVLSVADALHSHIVESVAMGQGYSLIVADASHNHSAESPTVSVAFVLAIQDALHSQAAESLALATHVTLVVSDALHAHLAGTASEITLPTGDRIFLVAHEDRLFLVAAEDRLFGV